MTSRDTSMVSNGKLILSLHGGIGNQLFQYAFGRAHSLRTGKRILFDGYGFHFDKKFKRKFALNQFNIPPNIIIEKYFVLFQSARLLRHLGRVGQSIISFFKLPFLIESLSEDNAWYKSSQYLKSCYMFGYWQDERYFHEYERQIRDDLSFCSILSNANTEVAEQIKNTPVPISVHVRCLHQVGARDSQKPRIESLTNGEVLSPEYYRRAIDLMIDKFPNGKFFVFSDYPKWAQANIQINADSYFLGSGRGSDIDDLRLMSMCDHHIIANSSFSWWGAWLATPKNQTVIAPNSAPLMPKIPDRWIAI